MLLQSSNVPGHSYGGVGCLSQTGVGDAGSRGFEDWFGVTGSRGFKGCSGMSAAGFVAFVALCHLWGPWSVPSSQSFSCHREGECNVARTPGVPKT